MKQVARCRPAGQWHRRTSHPTSWVLIACYLTACKHGIIVVSALLSFIVMSLLLVLVNEMCRSRYVHVSVDLARHERADGYNEQIELVDCRVWGKGQSWRMV